MAKKYFIPAYIFFILGLTIMLALKPDYNWDMLPYMAILEKMNGVKPFSRVHENVYFNAQKNLPQKKYKELVDIKDKYRTKMAADAFAFETQLPYFDIKPVYLISAFVFYKIGFSLAYATVLPSLISFAFINFISFVWLKKFSLSFKALLAALLLICCLAIPLATRSNPDGLSCLFLLTGSYFFLEYKNLFLSVFFLILSILVRPENIIFSFLLYSIVLAGKWERKVPIYISLIYLCLLALSYFLPEKLMSNAGWSSLFYHAFIDNTADPFVKQTITVSIYLKVIQENFLNIKSLALFILLFILSVLILQRTSFRFKKADLYQLYYVAVIASVIIKLLLFPMLSFRFILPSLLLLVFAAVKEYQLKYLRRKAQLHYNS